MRFSKPALILLALPTLLFASLGCARAAGDQLRITGIKTAHDIDDNFLPVHPQNKFPKSTVKVVCWFAWENARVESHLAVKWHYVTGDIPILTTDFSIPRKKGSGGVTLLMSAGKTLPPGLYEASFVFENKMVKSVRFEVLDK